MEAIGPEWRGCAVCGRRLSRTRDKHCTRACSNTASDRRRRGKPIANAGNPPPRSRGYSVPEAIRMLSRKVTRAIKCESWDYAHALEEARDALRRAEVERKKLVRSARKILEKNA